MSTMATIGEIIEASTTGFVAQCPRELLHQPPAFGTLVKVTTGQTPVILPAEEKEDDPFRDPTPSPSAYPLVAVPDETLYAVVIHAVTGSVEPGRRAAAYGLTEDALRQQQPQIFDLLATTFHSVHIGYAAGGQFRPHLPPCPPRLHGFVTHCTQEEVCAITDSPDFLRTLLAVPLQSDELLAACLRHACAARQNDFDYLVRIGKHLAILLRDSPDRLTALLRKLEP